MKIEREVFGNGENLLVCGSVMKLPDEIRALAGKAQCVYVDPPFMTGEKFMRRRPYGEKGWKTGKPAPRYPAYEDRYTSEKQYLRLLRRIISVTDYIKNNLTADDLSQSAMAEMAGISKDYFSRIFRSITGTNYSKWLNTIRLEKATELLADNNLTLTEIAMHSGFQSISSFNRVFHAEKGMSPGEYRALRMPSFPG